VNSKLKVGQASKDFQNENPFLVIDEPLSEPERLFTRTMYPTNIISKAERNPALEKKSELSFPEQLLEFRNSAEIQQPNTKLQVFLIFSS
jgi:hypothetical protein